MSTAVLQHRVGLVLAAACLPLLLAACAGPKGSYPGATAQLQQRAAVEESPSGAAADATTKTRGTYLRLVEQMQNDGLWFASLAHIDALEKQSGPSPESTRLRADALRQTGQSTESAAMYTQLVGTPLESAGYHGLGLLAGSRADYPEAVRLLLLARRGNPTDGLLLSDLGYAYLRAGQVAQARIPLMQAIQLQAESAQVQVNVALYLQASGQQDEARALMEARKMTPATRAAILDAARAFADTAAAAASASASPASSSAPASEAAPALALKPSAWPKRVTVMVRNQPSAPDTAVASTELATPVLSRGEQP